MTGTRRQILDMVSEGEISVEETKSLLGLLDQPSSVATGGGDTDEKRKSPPNTSLWWRRKTASPGTSA